MKKPAPRGKKKLPVTTKNRRSGKDLSIPKGRAPLIIPTAASLGAISVHALTDVRLLAQRQMGIEDEIAELNTQLSALAARLKQVKEEDLPLAFMAAGIKAITLADGSEVTVKDFLTGNIKEENSAAALAWLRLNKFGSLIKNTVKVAFGKGDDKKAKALAAFLKKEKVTYERREGVHPQTLQAFIRESLRVGRNLPPSIEVHSVPTTKIDRPKGE